MSPATVAPARRRSSGPDAQPTALPRRRPAPLAHATVTSPRTRPRPPVRAGATTAVPARRRTARPRPGPARAPQPARKARVVPPPSTSRRPSRVRLALWVLAAAAVVVTIAGFHAVLAQNQVRLEELRNRTEAAEARYVAQRLENGRLSAPSRVTTRAAEMGLVPPGVAPVAIPVLGEVPKRGGASTTLADWAEVKTHLDASP